MGSDVFRNFVIPVPAATTRYVRGIEFRAGNPRSLHHASVGVDRFRVSRKIDRSDPGPGFAAMPDDRVENVYGWSPGKVPFMEPADRAWSLEKGSDLVIQLHLLPTGAPEVVQPTVGLFFSDTPPTREPLTIRLESKAIDIPAGQADYAIDDSYLLPADVDLLSIYPHAHYLAKEMQGVARLPDGSVKRLITINAWDFRWQDQYRYKTPVFLPKGTTLSMHFTYDNSDRNARNPQHPPQRVKWGPQSTERNGRVVAGDSAPARRGRRGADARLHRALAARRHRRRRNAGRGQSRRRAGAQFPGHQVPAGRARAGRHRSSSSRRFA